MKTKTTEALAAQTTRALLGPFKVGDRVKLVAPIPGLDDEQVKRYPFGMEGTIEFVPPHGVSRGRRPSVSRHNFYVSRNRVFIRLKDNGASFYVDQDGIEDA